MHGASSQVKNTAKFILYPNESWSTLSVAAWLADVPRVLASRSRSSTSPRYMYPANRPDGRPVSYAECGSAGQVGRPAEPPEWPPQQVIEEPTGKGHTCQTTLHRLDSHHAGDPRAINLKTEAYVRRQKKCHLHNHEYPKCHQPGISMASFERKLVVPHLRARRELPNDGGPVRAGRSTPHGPPSCVAWAEAF